jgi:hypothetical protein
VLRDSLLVSEAGVTTAPFQLTPRIFGALRIECRVSLPSDTWADIKVAIVDAQGEPIAEAVKETWSEQGTWHEDGQSGSWAESDTELAWDVRPDTPEEARVELELLGVGSTNSLQELEGEKVHVDVVVSDGVVDFRWLLVGFIGASLVWVLVWYAAGHGGRPVIVERWDGEITARADCQGGLVAITVSGLLDETSVSPRLCLKVRDGDGVELVNLDKSLQTTAVRSEGELEGYRFDRKLYVLLLPGNYGFYVRVTPDPPIEWIKLLVRDSATTRGAVPIHRLAARPGSSREETGS